MKLAGRTSSIHSKSRTQTRLTGALPRDGFVLASVASQVLSSGWNQEQVNKRKTGLKACDDSSLSCLCSVPACVPGPSIPSVIHEWAVGRGSQPPGPHLQRLGHSVIKGPTVDLLVSSLALPQLTARHLNTPASYLTSHGLGPFTRLKAISNPGTYAASVCLPLTANLYQALIHPPVAS